MGAKTCRKTWNAEDRRDPQRVDMECGYLASRTWEERKSLNNRLRICNFTFSLRVAACDPFLSSLVKYFVISTWGFKFCSVGIMGGSFSSIWGFQGNWEVSADSVRLFCERPRITPGGPIYEELDTHNLCNTSFWSQLVLESFLQFDRGIPIMNWPYLLISRTWR